MQVHTQVARCAFDVPCSTTRSVPLSHCLVWAPEVPPHTMAMLDDRIGATVSLLSVGARGATPHNGHALRPYRSCCLIAQCGRQRCHPHNGHALRSDRCHRLADSSLRWVPPHRGLCSTTRSQLTHNAVARGKLGNCGDTISWI